MELRTFSGRLALQQRVLPVYRVAFFDCLAQACRGGLSIFAGKPLPNEGIATAQGLQIATFYEGRNWHVFNPQSPYYLCWQVGILRWLKSWNPDVLVVEANPRILSTLLAISWLRKRGKPVIGWGLGVGRASNPILGLREAGRRWFIHQFDAVIAYSRIGAEAYRQMGFPSDRVFVAPNAVMPKPQQPPPSRPSHIEGQLNVLFVGRLQLRKRVDHLLRACAQLPETIQPNLRIVGDGPARVEFEKLARTIYPRAEFIGASFGPDLEPFFRQADLFVLPGTGGLAVQQAMSYALPVIVAQGDGTQEDFVTPQNGWLVPADDVESLYHALLQALSDVDRLRQMGLESYRVVCERANIEVMREVFVQALEVVRRNVP